MAALVVQRWSPVEVGVKRKLERSVEVEGKEVVLELDGRVKVHELY